MDQQSELAHSTGELWDEREVIDPVENCPHTDAVRWNANRGRFECRECDEAIEIPELEEALRRDLAKPYDLLVEL